MKLVSVNVGLPETLAAKGKSVATGIFKKPVQGGVPLGKENLAGDGQADRAYHGGPDKAVCVYCAEHYPHWSEALARELGYGAFGENFTVQGMTEQDVCIGDRFTIGTALVQVTQPRQPCFKLAMKYDAVRLPAWVEETGYTGYYFRVLRQGVVEAGETFARYEADPAGITVAEANRLQYRDKSDVEGIRRLLAVAALSDSWRQSFERRLARL